MDEDFRKAWDLTEALLVRLQDSVQSAGSRFAVFYVPALTAIDGEVWTEAKRKYDISDEGWSPQTTRSMLAMICAENSIDLIDPQSDFVRELRRMESQDRHLYFRRDGHWNADGHALAAGVLSAYIQKSAL